MYASGFFALLLLLQHRPCCLTAPRWFFLRLRRVFAVVSLLRVRLRNPSPLRDSVAGASELDGDRGQQTVRSQA